MLFVYGTHFSKVKANHIITTCARNGIDVSFKSLRTIQKENNESCYIGYDLVILDEVNAKQSKELFGSILPVVKKYVPKMVTLNVLDANETKWRQGIEWAEHKQLHDYLDNGGAKNFQSFADFLANNIFGLSKKEASKPIIFPKMAIYHPNSPNKVFGSLEEYLKFLDVNATGKKIVAISMYQSNFASMDSELIDETVRRLSQKENVIPVPFYFPYIFGKDERGIPYKDLLSLDGEFRADAIIYYQMMHQAQKRRKEFEQLGVPVFGGLIFREGNTTAFEEDKQGISAFMTPFALSLPETAGVINPMIVASKNTQNYTTQIIDYQLDSFLRRINNYLNLQSKANKDKKVAFFFWNYPLGQNAMGASFLNVPESFAKLFGELKKKGYTTQDVNALFFTDRIKDMMSFYYREVNVSELVQRDLCELYPLEKYEAWFATLPQKVQNELIDVWGEANSSSMLVTLEGKQYFAIPRMKVDNFIVLPQGSRIEDKQSEKGSYHDMATPVSHGYLAVYLYAKEIFGVDAIVHMGTHGSQEWLKGKERALLVYDSPNLVVGDTPVIYPYIVDDVGEAMQAKRRGSAVLLSHLTPPFSPAGLHGELVELHELIHQYNDMIEGRAKEKIKSQIIKSAQELSFDKEIDANATKDFAHYIEVLHDYMEEIALENQPLGLHTYGEPLSKEYAILTVMQMLGSGYAKAAWKADIQEGLEYRDEHHDYDGDSHEHEVGHHHDHDIEHQEANSKDAYHREHEYVLNYENITKSKQYRILEAAIDGKIYKDEELKAYLEQGLEYYRGIMGSLELKNIIDALDGKYIPTSTGGDLVRTPEVLPTGRNLYGFDPSKVPTKAAYETGKEMTRELIENYYAKHGVYPDKLAFSLWSIETMRHYGVLEAQILYALGIKPIWEKGGGVSGMEIIPYSELKRPRIDVVISATGLYRDAFPNVMEYLDKAVRKIVALKEEHNFVRANALALEKELIAEGVDENQAKKLSTIRLFSNASGTYGTALAREVMASGNWDDDSNMAEGYMSRMGFAFGSGIWGEKVAKRLYQKNLKGTDAAMLSRSSNVYGLLTSDDPFQYLGGVALAVRNIDGKTPELYITNLRNKSNAKVESIQKFMSKELRTRYMHPGWIKAMQEEGYAGAQEIVGVVQNTWGWEVMDPSTIRDDQWQEFVEVYINDKHNLDMKEFFEKNNPDALAQISERFLEAIRKGYFKTDEKTIKKLVETYMEIANKYNVYTDNEKLKEYLKGKAVGYGLNDLLPNKIQTRFDMPPVATLAPKGGESKFKGQELVEQKDTPIEEEYTYLYLLFGILGIIVLGILYQALRKED